MIMAKFHRKIQRKLDYIIKSLINHSKATEVKLFQRHRFSLFIYFLEKKKTVFQSIFMQLQTRSNHVM